MKATSRRRCSVPRGTRSEAAGQIIRKEYGYRPAKGPKAPDYQPDEAEEAEEEDLEDENLSQ